MGSKLEHNDYTGLEYEPSTQLVWTPSDRHTLWTSVSRAIRQPNRADFGTRLNVAVTPVNGMLALITLSGNSNVKAEQLYDYEAGYRTQLNSKLSLDVATFLSDYHDLETAEPGTPYLATNPGAAPYLVLPLSFANLARARDYGAELFLRWTPVRRWTLSPGYSFLQMSVQNQPGSGDTFASMIPGGSPQAPFPDEFRSESALECRVERHGPICFASGGSEYFVLRGSGYHTAVAAARRPASEYHRAEPAESRGTWNSGMCRRSSSPARCSAACSGS